MYCFYKYVFLSNGILLLSDKSKSQVTNHYTTLKCDLLQRVVAALTNPT